MGLVLSRSDGSCECKAVIVVASHHPDWREGLVLDVDPPSPAPAWPARMQSIRWTMLGTPSRLFACIEPSPGRAMPPPGAPLPKSLSAAGGAAGLGRGE